MEKLVNRAELEEGKIKSSFEIGLCNVNFFSLQKLNNISSEKEMNARIPGGLRQINKDTVDLSKPNINIFLDTSDHPEISIVDNSNFHLNGPLNKESFMSRLPFIAYSLSERIRQESLGECSMHAAAVATKDGKSILILGDKGSGKTSMAIALGRELDFGLVGNDLIVVRTENEKLSIPAGNQIFDIRAAVMRNYFNDSLQDKSRVEMTHPYEDKITILPNELGIKQGFDLRGIIAIIRVNIHPGNEPTIINEGPRKTQEVLRLRENLSRYIRGMTTPLSIEGSLVRGSFPSLDTQELEEMRNRMILSMLSMPFFYVVSDSPQKAAYKLTHEIL